jgi:hypothetical protein
MHLPCAAFELGRVDAGNESAATNSRWVFQTSVDVIILLLLLLPPEIPRRSPHPMIAMRWVTACTLECRTPPCVAQPMSCLVAHANNRCSRYPQRQVCMLAMYVCMLALYVCMLAMYECMYVSNVCMYVSNVCMYVRNVCMYAITIPRQPEHHSQPKYR